MNEGKQANETCWRQEVSQWDNGPTMHATSSPNNSYHKTQKYMNCDCSDNPMCARLMSS